MPGSSPPRPKDPPRGPPEHGLIGPNVPVLRDNGQMYPGTVGLYADGLRVGTVATRHLDQSPAWLEEWMAHDWARLRRASGPLEVRWRELGQDHDRPAQVQVRSRQQYDYRSPPSASEVELLVQADDPWARVEGFAVMNVVDGVRSERGWLFRRFAHRAEGAESGVDHWMLSADYRPPDGQVSLLLEPRPAETWPDARAFFEDMERRRGGRAGWSYVNLPYAWSTEP